MGWCAQVVDMYRAILLATLTDFKLQGGGGPAPAPAPAQQRAAAFPAAPAVPLSAPASAPAALAPAPLPAAPSAALLPVRCRCRMLSLQCPGCVCQRRCCLFTTSCAAPTVARRLSNQGSHGCSKYKQAF